MDSEESNTGRIDACYDEICADMPLVAEEMLLEQRHAGDHSRFPAGGERVQFEFGRDESSCEFGVCSGSSSSTPDLRRDVVKLLTVLQIINWCRNLTKFVMGSTLSATIGPLVALVSAAI